MKFTFLSLITLVILYNKNSIRAKYKVQLNGRSTEDPKFKIEQSEDCGGW